MPEQFALQQVLRDGRAVDLDQRAGRAGAPGMNDIGQHLLAHAALARNQDAAVRGGDQRRVMEHRLHERAPGHHPRRQGRVRAELPRRGPGQARRLLDRGQQLVQVNRFGQVIQRAVAHGTDRLANIGISGDEQDGQDGMFMASAPKGFRPESPGMRTSEIIMLMPPARRTCSASSPELTGIVAKPWLRRNESSRLRCPGSSSTIRMRGPFTLFARGLMGRAPARRRRPPGGGRQPRPSTCRRAARMRSTLRTVAPWPIRPIRQARPAIGPSPAPISMLYSSSRRRRTAASSAPAGM